MPPIVDTDPMFAVVTTINDQIIRGHLLELRRRNLSPATIEIRRRCAERLAEWMHPRMLTDTTPDDVEEFLDQRGVGARTRYAWCSNIHRLFDFAIRHDLAHSDPTVRVIRPKIDRLLPRPISDHDLAYAMRQAASSTMRAWLMLGALGGLRVAEIAGLQRSDVLDDDRLLRVIGKGRKERVVPMHDTLYMGLRGCGLPDIGNVFVRPHGEPYSAMMVSQHGSQFFESIGVDCTMHQLRHWFGTKTYRECQDLRTVQELMGHASPVTTAIYTAISPTRARAAVDALALPA